ncbi:BEL1-like homeodomain protein 8 [Bidens hawaiensis]|uniref:BEL1-like homeodomain protein 8 n=1 Tax=Bidens hawaiensis TaxID=980011 RepID=UPI0040498FF5
MEMNNLQRVESHVAQKNRRHKLRFQHNSGDLNHHQLEQPYNVLPSHLLLPTTTHGFVSNNNINNNIQDPSNDVTTYANLPYTQDCNNNNIWKPVVSSQQQVASHDHWMNIDHTHSFSSTPFYHNTLHQQHHVTLALPPQGLSLSLSSVSSIPHLKDQNEPILQPGPNPLKSDLLPNPDPKPFVGVSGFAHRNTGPLGPFTGYATILKNSKYIKPAQELLSASCEVGYQELVQACHDAYSHKILEEEMSRVSDRPVGSYGESDESLRPEFHRKKVRLLYMQEEVCKRYKQYLQQMQMVISSFETVAGLSAATPYVCLALKALSRHFYHVKNVISEQLSQMTKTVGEGFCSSTNVSKTFDANATSTSRIKSSGGGAAGFFVPQQPVWRPQRGLPERAIAVLKTWLFDHFLHPYPSDADKHMLATQTGLTRTQVSNWFINARVRIWKPMVEEIHTLETKGLTEANSSHPQPDGQDPNWMDMSSLSNTQPPECSRNPGVNVNSTVDESHGHLLDHEKQPRPDQYDIPLSGMDRLMSIMPYPRATLDATGLGPVSLTLGLRQNAEHVQHLQQHFGGQLIHDFVG